MDYLREVRKKAQKEGYDPNSISYANDGKHKVQIVTPTGKTVKFGLLKYGDFILWTHLEREGQVPKGYSKMKRRVFHASHEAMRGNWKSNPFSPNRLALAILW